MTKRRKEEKRSGKHVVRRWLNKQYRSGRLRENTEN